MQTHPFANLVILAPLISAHNLAFFKHTGDLEGIGSMKHPPKALQQPEQDRIIQSLSTLHLRPPFTQVRCISYSHLKVTIGTQQMCILWV